MQIKCVYITNTVMKEVIVIFYNKFKLNMYNKTVLNCFNT